MFSTNETTAHPLRQTWEIDHESGLLRSGVFSSRLSPTSIILWLIAVTVVFILRRRFFTPISHVPGPVAASFTRLWHIYQILKGKQNDTLVGLHDKLGHFVRISHNEVSVSHPAAIKALLLKPVPKGPWYQIFSFPDWRSPAAISIRDPRERTEFLKYISHAGFLMHNVMQYEDSIDGLVGKLLDWMDDHASSQAPIDLSSFFTYTAFDILGEITFSSPFGFLDQGIDVGHGIATNIGLEIYLCIFGFYPLAASLLSNPFMTWLGILPVGQLVKTSIAALKGRQRNPDARFDMAAHWFRGLEKARKDGHEELNERHVLSAAVANLGAGSDTISCGLQTFVYCLIRRRHLWNRVREEIKAAQQDGHCGDRVITYEDASKLPFLDACIKESMRFMAPVPMGLPRIAPKGGVMIGETSFPEGTCLSINPAVMHLSKEVWGPDAREFNPDRWFRPDIATQEKYFMPWGLGWASCPGQQLAKVEMFKILATIVRDYDVKLVHPEKEWRWKAYFTLNPEDWPVYVSRNIASVA